MSMSCGESEASLARRARVAQFRIRQGELVEIPAWDPMLAVYLDLDRLARPHGNPIGAIPEAL